LIELQTSQNIIRQLQETLTANGIAVPLFDAQVAASDQLATINIVSNTPETQVLRAQFPGIETSGPSQFGGANAGPPIEIQSHLGIIDRQRQPHLGVPASRPPAPAATQLHPTGNAFSNSEHPHGLDSGLIGINFVLALEQPCLTHLHMLSPELEEVGSTGTGHEAMLSSPVMARAPTFASDPFTSGFPADAEWTVPTIELEALLALSRNLELEEEITPVQAWQLVKEHTHFSLVSYDGLEYLKHILLPLVECYGYDHPHPSNVRYL